MTSTITNMYLRPAGRDTIEFPSHRIDELVALLYNNSLYPNLCNVKNIEINWRSQTLILNSRINYNKCTIFVITKPLRNSCLYVICSADVPNGTLYIELSFNASLTIPFAQSHFELKSLNVYNALCPIVVL